VRFSCLCGLPDGGIFTPFRVTQSFCVINCKPKLNESNWSLKVTSHFQVMRSPMSSAVASHPIPFSAVKLKFHCAFRDLNLRRAGLSVIRVQRHSQPKSRRGNDDMCAKP
jgi:hypothetical protein